MDPSRAERLRAVSSQNLSPDESVPARPGGESGRERTMRLVGRLDEQVRRGIGQLIVHLAQQSRRERWTVRDLEDILDQVDDLQAQCVKQVGDVVQRVNVDAQGAVVSPGSGGGRSTANPDGTPPSKTQALAFKASVSKDPVPRAAHQLVAGLLIARWGMRLAASRTAYLAGLSPEVLDRLIKRSAPKAPQRCANPYHEYIVANTPSDPLLKGMCRACYDYDRREAERTGQPGPHWRPFDKIPEEERATRAQRWESVGGMPA